MVASDASMAAVYVARSCGHDDGDLPLKHSPRSTDRQTSKSISSMLSKMNMTRMHIDFISDYWLQIDEPAKLILLVL
ncbi:hypothetical protein L1887_34916 [Cichorium endivia]|nr:hypothetical protein L1887_34916 [Cichorium endivia]